MKKVVFLFLFWVLAFSLFSCKKDTKTEKILEVEHPLDSETIVEAGTIMEKEETKGVIIEKPKKKKKEVAKKQKTATKTKSKKEGYGKDGGTMKIPGTSLTTNNGMAKKYIYDYEKYVVRYRKAVEAKDMNSFLRLSDASSSLSKQYTRLMGILPGEEIEKLSKYMDVKSRQLDMLSSQM